MLNNNYTYRDTGLLILRIGIGAMFMLHGAPKLFGGPKVWTKLGSAMSNVGVDVAPVFWGFMAGFAEFGGGLLLALGAYFQPAVLLLFITMVVAASKHLHAGDGIKGAAHAVESGILFLSLLFIGPGKYSLDAYLFKSSKKARKGKMPAR